ncbi:hypothetical protein ACFQY4_44205 [Catellatospora bangladeshensis]|uniref:hypothetical protein n=1 Tax=Catellatospora bangladeshensis TaxID=310355 RepID=UPI0036127727
MNPRLARLAAVVLLALTAGCAPAHADAMPDCPVGRPASVTAPSGPPSLHAPGTCRSHATVVQPVTAAVPSPGYHHLGATTRGRWSGVLGRIEVGDVAVRPGTYDFVAARFMAKTGDGAAWLEVGWTETGWSGTGRQRVYTYDTATRAWAFYDQYDVRPGDRLWLHLQTESTGASPAWQAWLWWGDTWHLLTSRPLPLTGQAQIEQYVEVHADPVHPGALTIPPLTVSDVALKSAPDAPCAPGTPTSPPTPAPPSPRTASPGSTPTPPGPPPPAERKGTFLTPGEGRATAGAVMIAVSCPEVQPDLRFGHELAILPAERRSPGSGHRERPRRRRRMSDRARPRDRALPRDRDRG